MNAKYLIITEVEDACATVEFNDDGYPTIKINPVDFSEDDWDWESFGRMVEHFDFWSDKIKDVIDIIAKTGVKSNWYIDIGDGVRFECFGLKANWIDLGTLAECYDDCDTCDNHCYSFKNESPYEDKCDCPNYYRCQEVYGEDDDGNFDSLWDFRCQCTNINGRDALLKLCGGLND